MPKQPKVKGVPVEYMDVQTLWSDRRDPHASPLSAAPRRMYGRAPTMSSLHDALEGVYRGGQPTGPK